MVRHIIAILAGAIVTCALLWLMRAVIASPDAATDSGIKGRVLDFVQVQEDQEVVVKKRVLKPPPPPEPLPPSRPKPRFESEDSRGIDIGAVTVDVEVEPNPGRFSSDGEYLPIVKVQPIYPRRAQTHGIEGYVLLEFVVTATGAVRDPVVVDAMPPGIFDRAAVNAALKFKYKPKVVGGKPIAVAGVRNLIKFEIQE